MDIEAFYQRRPGDLVFLKSDIDLLPDGSTLIHGGDTLTKTDGAWFSGSHPLSSFSPSAHGETAIKSLPSDWEYPHDTLEQYQWKVNDVARAAAARHGVSGVPETMTALEVDLGKFPVGRGTRIINQSVLNDLAVLPPDSLVSCGHPDADDFTLWRRERHSWVRAYGPMHCDITGAVIVEEVGGVEYGFEWADAVGDSSADPAVDQFKVKMWKTGQESAGRYSWCGVFRQVMSYLGVDANIVREIELSPLSARGQRVTPQQAAAMPLGTLFRYVRSNGNTIWCQRVSDAGNSSGTRRILAFDQNFEPVHNGGNYASNMSLLGRVGERVPMPNRNTLALLNSMRSGTRIALQPEGDGFVLNGQGRFGQPGDIWRHALSGYWGVGLNSQACYLIVGEWPEHAPGPVF